METLPSEGLKFGPYHGVILAVPAIFFAHQNLRSTIGAGTSLSHHDDMALARTMTKPSG